MARQLPPMREILLSDVLTKGPPVPKIKTEEDVELWKTTRSYSDLGLFLQRLNEAVVGHFLPFMPQSLSQVSRLEFATLNVPTDPRFLACSCCYRSSRQIGYMDRRNSAPANSPKIWKPCVQDMGKEVGGCTLSAFSVKPSFLTSVLRMLANCSRQCSPSSSTLRFRIFLLTF